MGCRHRHYIGANLTIFAVPVQLYALTQNSAYVGLSGIFAPRATGRVRPVGRRLGRRDGPARLLIIAIVRVGGGVGSVWVQAALSLNNVWVVLCLLSVQQAFFAINQPTRSAAIPRMIPAINCLRPTR